MASKNPKTPSVVKFSFRTNVSQAWATNGDTYATLNLTAPNLGTRGADLAADFEFFRNVKLHVYSFVDGPVLGTSSATVGGGVYHAISYLNTPQGSFNAPTTKQLHAQHENYVVGNGFHKISLSIDRRDIMAQPFKWFNTYTTGSVPASSQSAGTITYMIGIGPGVTVQSISQTIVVEGVVEAHTPISYGDTFRVRIPLPIRDDPTIVKAVDRLNLAVKTAEEEVESSCGVTAK